MYGFDWIEQLRRGRQPPGLAPAYSVSPVVWALGLTSLLTDVSSEMVSSILPLYLVLHLHLSPMQFGAIDGVYNGFATLLIALAAGWYADRTRRQKEVAAVGYGLSALCKLLLMMAGGAWAWILLVVGIDRIGKGLRSAPRDALISLHTPSAHLATAFGVHRAMDAAGALLGPLLAFLIIAWMPAAFDLIWTVSFVFAVLGVAAILMLVPARKYNADAGSTPPTELAVPLASDGVISRRFVKLAACAALLAAATISDNFVYLLLQKKSAAHMNYLPLFPVVNAASYMLLAVPFSRFADRRGRMPMFLGGYAVMLLLYCLLASSVSLHSVLALAGCLILLGVYYAATEGVLVALASHELPVARRTVGLALLATAVGLGKMSSSLVFGWAWSAWGEQAAIWAFLGGLVISGAVVVRVLGSWNDR